jgi:hypothetical protein
LRNIRISSADKQASTLRSPRTILERDGVLVPGEDAFVAVGVAGGSLPPSLLPLSGARTPSACEMDTGLKSGQERRPGLRPAGQRARRSHPLSRSHGASHAISRGSVGCPGLARTRPGPTPVWSARRRPPSRSCTISSSTRALSSHGHTQHRRTTTLVDVDRELTRGGVERLGALTPMRPITLHMRERRHLPHPSGVSTPPPDPRTRLSRPDAMNPKQGGHAGRRSPNEDQSHLIDERTIGRTDVGVPRAARRTRGPWRGILASARAGDWRAPRRGRPPRR